jgi:DNA-binding MarR family transcriptional regulator
MTENSIPLISKLEKVGVAQILLYLYINRFHDEITVNELIDNIQAVSATVQKTIDSLEANNLITIEKTKVFPFKHKIKLTSVGLEVAEPLTIVASALQKVEGSTDKSKH